jgi:hypothetical protein
VELPYIRQSWQRWEIDEPQPIHWTSIPNPHGPSPINGKKDLFYEQISPKNRFLPTRLVTKSGCLILDRPNRPYFHWKPGLCEANRG